MGDEGTKWSGTIRVGVGCSSRSSMKEWPGLKWGTAENWDVSVI